MYIELPAEISSDHDICRDRLVQINVYNAGIEEFKKCGIDVLTFLKSLGFSNCLIMEVPLLSSARIPANGRRQNHNVPEANQESAVVSVFPTVADADSEPFEILRNVKEEVIEPTMEIDRETLSPEVESFSGVPAPCRTSTRIEDDEVSTRAAKECSTLVCAPSNSNEFFSTSGSLNKFGSEDNMRSAQAQCEFNKGDAEGVPISEVCCLDTQSDSQACHIVSENVQASSFDECRRGLQLDLNANNEKENTILERGPSNLSTDTVLLGEVQDCFENMERTTSNDVTTQTIYEDIDDHQSDTGNKTPADNTSRCARNYAGNDETFVESRSGCTFTENDCFFSPDATSLNIDGTPPLRGLQGDRLNQGKSNNISNLLNDILGVAYIVDGNIVMGTSSADARPVDLPYPEIPDDESAVAENISTEAQCSYSYSYPNPVLSADESINNTSHREVKLETLDENECLNASTAVNCTIVGKTENLRDEPGPSFNVTTPIGVNKTEISFDPDDCVNSGYRDFEDAPEYQTEKDSFFNSSDSGGTSPKKRRRSKKTVYKCHYPDCKAEFRQRMYVHQKLITHVQSHSPVPLFPCLVTGCNAKLKTSQTIARHYAKLHPGVPFPGVSAIKRESAKTAPPDIEATLWKQCFPEDAEAHPYIRRRIRNLIRAINASNTSESSQIG